MKKNILLGLLWLAVIACGKKEGADPQVNSETTIVSSAKKSALKYAGDDFKIQLLEVADSRCPINADCITAGSADVKINVSDGTNQTEVHVVFGGTSNPGNKEFQLGGQTYLLTISEVLPYPEIFRSRKLEDYKIAVRIEKK